MTGTSAKELAAEAANKTAREILRAIDSLAEPLESPRAQQDFLREIIRSKDLQLARTGGKLVSHTVESIKHSMAAISKKKTDTSLKTRDIWSRGSSMIDSDYLTAIGLREPTNATANEEHASIYQPSPKLASTNRPPKLKLKAPVARSSPVSGSTESTTPAGAAGWGSGIQRPNTTADGGFIHGDKKRSVSEAALDGIESAPDQDTARKRQRQGELGDDEDDSAGHVAANNSRKRSATDAALDGVASDPDSSTIRKRQRRVEQPERSEVAGSSQSSEDEYVEESEVRQPVTARTAHSQERTVEIPSTARTDVQEKLPSAERPTGAPQKERRAGKSSEAEGSRERTVGDMHKPNVSASAASKASQERANVEARNQNAGFRRTESSIVTSLAGGDMRSPSVEETIKAGLESGQIKSLDLIRLALTRDDVVLEDVIRESNRKLPMEDFGKGRIIAPKTNAQAGHAEHLAEHLDTRIYDQLFPPELPGSTRHNHSADSLYQAALGTASGAIKQTAYRAANFGINFARPNGLEYDVEAQYVEHPEAGLKALYCQVLGSDNWKRTMLERQNQTQQWQHNAGELLASLIAASVYNTVFQVKQPWDIENTIESAVGDRLKFGELAMLDKGYQLSGFLRQWTFKMMNDKDFQGTEVQAHARSLATELAMTLSPHLALMRRAQKPAEKRYNPGPADNMDWVEYLQRVFHEALVVKGKIETYDDHAFEYFWPKPGSEMEGEGSMPLHENKQYKQVIVLVMWPGVRVEKISGLKKDSFYLAEASVLTYTPPDQYAIGDDA